MKGCRTCERVGCVSSPVFALLIILSLASEGFSEQHDVRKSPEGRPICVFEIRHLLETFRLQ